MATLKAYLNDTGITQERFAEVVGTTQANISKLCGDRPRISSDLAFRIEEATGGKVPIEVWPQFSVFAKRHALANGPAPAAPQPAPAEKDR